jgi:hypothetical protein
MVKGPIYFASERNIGPVLVVQEEEEEEEEESLRNYPLNSFDADSTLRLIRCLKDVIANWETAPENVAVLSCCS